MERTILRILEPNKTIYYKNRQVRTPVNIEVTEKELKGLYTSLRLAGITKFKVETVIDDKHTIIDHPILVEEDKKVVIEDLDEEPKTLLERLAKE